MSFTIHDVKLLLRWAFIFSLNAIDFQSAGVYYGRGYFYQGNKRKICGKKLFNAVIFREAVLREMM